MKIADKKIYQKILETTICIVVIVSLTSSMLTPQIATAETQEVASTLLAPMAEEIFVPAEFPTAGNREPSQVIWVTVTAYSSDVAQTDSTPCIPANGYDLCKAYAKNGEGDSIAANFLTFDTQISLPEVFGNKIFVVRDRMNRRYGHGRIDVWMPTYEEAKQFGVKRIKMNIY